MTGRRCVFRIRGELAECIDCGRPLPTRQSDPSKIHRRCLVAGPPTPLPQPVRLDPGPCIHRGAVVREERCKLCGDRERIEPIHACTLHGTCTQHRYRLGQPESICLTCDDLTPPS